MITITTLALAFSGLVFEVSPARIDSISSIDSPQYSLVGLDCSIQPMSTLYSLDSSSLSNSMLSLDTVNTTPVSNLNNVNKVVGIGYDLIGLDYSIQPVYGDLLNLDSIYKFSSLMSGINSSAAFVVTSVDFKETTYTTYLYGLQGIEVAGAIYTSDTLQVENTNLGFWSSIEAARPITLNTNLIANYTGEGSLYGITPNIQSSYVNLEYLHVLPDNAITGKPIQGYSIGIAQPGIVSSVAVWETQTVTLIQFWS